jgi:hypothetical protein
VQAIGDGVDAFGFHGISAKKTDFTGAGSRRPCAGTRCCCGLSSAGSCGAERIASIQCRAEVLREFKNIN